MSAVEFADIAEAMFSRHGIQWRCIDRKERQSFWTEWRTAFSGRLHETTGKWVLGGFDWHVFLTGHAHSVHSAKAEVMFQEIESKHFYMVPSANTYPSYVCAGDCSKLYADIHELLLPTLDCVFDLYVAEQLMQWTFVMTHEDDSGMGFGPYFALRNWQEPDGAETGETR